jgi:hypothetical protein
MKEVKVERASAYRPNTRPARRLTHNPVGFFLRHLAAEVVSGGLRL